MPKKPLTKSQLFAFLAEDQEMSKRQVKAFMEALTTAVYDEVKRSGAFTLPGLGKFTMKDRKARIGRNPATGEKIKIPAKTVLKFRVAKAAKDSIL